MTFASGAAIWANGPTALLVIEARSMRYPTSAVPGLVQLDGLFVVDWGAVGPAQDDPRLLGEGQHRRRR